MNLCKDCKHSYIKAQQPSYSNIRHVCTLQVEANDPVSGRHIYLPCSLARGKYADKRCGPDGTKFEKASKWQRFVKGIFW